jgi:hypothetical protein
VSGAGVSLLEWPANSPDLSPIENAWSIVQHKLDKQVYSSFDDYCKKLQDTWLSLDTAHIRALIDDMPKRMQEALDAGGGQIRR